MKRSQQGSSAAPQKSQKRHQQASPAQSKKQTQPQNPQKPQKGAQGKAGPKPSVPKDPAKIKGQVAWEIFGKELSALSKDLPGDFLLPGFEANEKTTLAEMRLAPKVLIPETVGEETSRMQNALMEALGATEEELDLNTESIKTIYDFGNAELERIEKLLKAKKADKAFASLMAIADLYEQYPVNVWATETETPELAGQFVTRLGKAWETALKRSHQELGLSEQYCLKEDLQYVASRLRELLLQVAEEQGKADYFGPVEWPFSIEFIPDEEGKEKPDA